MEGQSRLRDRGFTMVEVSIATGLITLVMLILAGAMSTAVRLTGGARQRSSASALAVERVERVRNLAFDQVALSTLPTPSNDPDNPDSKVSVIGGVSHYDNGQTVEPLIVDATDGALPHLEDPVTLGNSELYIHQFVTWVDDPSPQLPGTEDYKRVTVVVVWKRSLNDAVSDRITMWTFVGKGNVTIPGVTPAPSPTSSPSPAPAPTPTPTPGVSCTGDTDAPTGSVTIQSGTGAQTGFTNSLSVQVQLTTTDSCPVINGQLSNDGASFTNVASMTSGVSQTVAWSVPTGDGTKTVSARYRDDNGNLSPVYTASIVVDQTEPTVPGDFRESTCSISSNDRTVNVTWDPSTDTNLSGYRLYRSIEGGAFTAVATTTALFTSDTSSKNDDSTRYMVRAYDKAGNESDDSAIKTYTKNSC